MVRYGLVAGLVVFFRAPTGEDGPMSSESNVSPGEPMPPVVAEPDTGTHHGAQAEDVKFTRAAALWSSLILGFLILIVLLIFITQNTASTPFTFLTWHWDLPLGGGLITALVSAARMFQLRRAAKKNLQFALKR
jgi:uncharacterized integral membrane protein